MRLFKNMNEKTGKARLDAAEILIKNLWAERVTLRHCLYVSTSMKRHAERFAKQLSEVGRKIPVKVFIGFLISLIFIDREKQREN